MSDNISDAEIEAVARAIFIVARGGVRCPPMSTAWKDYEKDARAAILASRAALLAEDKKVVAREPSEAMCDAGGNCGGFEFDGESGTIYPAPIWRAMWDAAP